jgi:acyl-CoA reductase-like NAD-dependent aldehyde dehydrogenase
VPKTIAVIDPSSGALVGEIPDEAVDEVAGHVAAARQAQRAWGACPPGERAARLREAATCLRARADDIAHLQTRESGKLLRDSMGGVLAGVAMLEQYAELAPVHRGRSLHGSPGATDLIVVEPRGVAAVIVPWNDPVAIACQGIAANLAAGNTVVVKPSERAPLAVTEVARTLSTFLPPGVVRVASGGARAGAALVEHPHVDVVVHTGSVTTGRWIAERCATSMKKAVLELGGKDPLVVDADVDPEWAAGVAATAAFANAGQICVSAERLLVHRAVVEPFVAALTARAEAMRVGDPLDAGTDMGPLVDEAQVAHVLSHIGDAVDRGARVAAGGSRLAGPGCFVRPTVLLDVVSDALTWREETFGPVAPIRVVESFDEGLEAAAHDTYGLAAVVLTRSWANAQRAARELPAGTVKVNSAFGGAPGGAAHPFRMSGNALGYGPELLDEVTRWRVIHLEPAP